MPRKGKFFFHIVLFLIVGIWDGACIQVYADDTSFHLGELADSLSKSLQRDFNSRQRWLLDNKLILSLKETRAVSYPTDGKLERMEACIFTYRSSESGNF